MQKDSGLTVIGQAEYDEQVKKHGSKRQVMQLAKNLMRVFAVMGLGPTGVDGLQSDVCSMEATEQCSGTSAPATVVQEHDPLLCSWCLHGLFSVEWQYGSSSNGGKA